MSLITISRQDHHSPADMEPVRDFLFRAIDGFSREDKRAWRGFWKRIFGMKPGELAVIEARLPRSGPFHRRHMAIEQTVFDSQDRFQSFEQFRAWIKIGAGWVDWHPGEAGIMVPIPKSISYSKADQEEFTKFHEAAIQFLRGEHATRYLWPHLSTQKAGEMMDTLLLDFD